MFEPPRCPRPRCPAHRRPRGRWWIRKGSYHPRCRPRPVPRFRCRRCGRGFSRQTFRADYRDKKPDANLRLFRLLGSGVGLRQSARMLGLRRNTVYAKSRKMGLHLLHVQRSLLRRLQLHDAVLMLDEMETFEGCRVTRPLTLPVVIERESMFVIAADADTIPARGRLRPSSRRILEQDLARDGRRRNRSSRVVGRLLKTAAARCRGPALLICDEKRTYPVLARRAFGAERIEVQQHSSKLRRDSANPLFRINLTNAMFRDLVARLRRRSWLASKRRKYLRSALAVFVCYRNFVRPRFNRDAGRTLRTPAQFLGLCRHPTRPGQLLSWRQDWGPRSPALPL